MSEEQKKSIETFLDALVYSMQKNGNRKLFVTDKNYEKTGIDYLLSDKQAAAAIIKKAQSEFIYFVFLVLINIVFLLRMIRYFSLPHYLIIRLMLLIWKHGILIRFL